MTLSSRRGGAAHGEIDVQPTPAILAHQLVEIVDARDGRGAEAVGVAEEPDRSPDLGETPPAGALGLDQGPFGLVHVTPQQMTGADDMEHDDRQRVPDEVVDLPGNPPALAGHLLIRELLPSLQQLVRERPLPIEDRSAHAGHERAHRPELPPPVPRAGEEPRDHGGDDRQRAHGVRAVPVGIGRHDRQDGDDGEEEGALDPGVQVGHGNDDGGGDEGRPCGEPRRQHTHDERRKGGREEEAAVTFGVDQRDQRPDRGQPECQPGEGPVVLRNRSILANLPPRWGPVIRPESTRSSDRGWRADRNAAYRGSRARVSRAVLRRDGYRCHICGGAGADTWITWARVATVGAAIPPADRAAAARRACNSRRARLLEQGRARSKPSYPEWAQVITGPPGRLR